MRARVVVVGTLFAACGINPAFGDPPADTAASTTDGPPATAASTSADPSAPTDAGATSGPAATGDASTETTTSSGTTDATTGAADVTSASTTGDASTGPPADPCPDDPSLIACYAFEEPPQDGVMLDGSAYGHHGSRAGTNAIASLAGFGDAVDLLGGSDVHVISYPAFAPEVFTLSALVFVKQGQVNKGLVDRAGTYRLIVTDGLVTCRLTTDEDDAEVSLAVVVEHWYHFACTFDGQTLTLHGHGPAADPPPAQVPLEGELMEEVNSEFIVGRVAGDDATKYAGPMDQVMLFDRVLDADAACALAGPLCP